MTEKIKIVRTLRTLRGRVWEWRGKGETIALSRQWAHSMKGI